MDTENSGTVGLQGIKRPENACTETITYTQTQLKAVLEALKELSERRAVAIDQLHKYEELMESMTKDRTKLERCLAVLHDLEDPISTKTKEANRLIDTLNPPY